MRKSRNRDQEELESIERCRASKRDVAGNQKRDKIEGGIW